MENKPQAFLPNFHVGRQPWASAIFNCVGIFTKFVANLVVGALLHD
jgi:hypothetical protein